jgi:hyperosmotically inducible periplasmic protein
MRQLFQNRARALSSILFSLVIALALVGSLYAAAPSWFQAPRDAAHFQAWLTKEVRHELVMLPYLTIFDNLEYEVDGAKVTLLGQVIRPALKRDAENAVKHIEGVEAVDNQIEVLPPSPNDDRIRRAEHRAIYGFPSLNWYAVGALPSIRIIVKGGNVTLEGVVDSEADKNAAGLQASTVHGVFSVKNNLRVAGGK